MSFIGRSSPARLVGTFVIVVLAAGLWLVIGGGGSTASATTADGDVVLGTFPVNQPCTPGVDVNCEQNSTVIQVQPGQDNNGLEVQADGFGFGIAGFTNNGIGVWGQSGSGHGVEGDSTSNYALYGDSTQATGGHIQTESQFGAGLEVAINNSSTTMPNRRGALEASTNGFGQAVLATAISGSGVEGHSASGAGLLGVADTRSATALKATGKTTLSGPTTLGGTSSFTGTTTFARSGRLTIPAGSAQATKASISLGSSSSVLATIQGNQQGVYVQGVTVVAGSSGSFTIHLNQTTPVNLPVAWFVLS
jgi:hypothetical protein